MNADRYRGILYRALNPLYARSPLSGRGAALYGGRFNAKGQEALYTSLDISTAIREANQVGTLQPTTLVAYRADLRPVLDTRDKSKLAAYGIDNAGLAADDWRDLMRRGASIPTQRFADRLRGNGFAGFVVHSFAKGARQANLNLVVLRWNTDETDRIEIVDDDRRLV